MATILLRHSDFDWFSLPLFLIILVVSTVARYWRFFTQWLDGLRGREWTLTSAVVDVVSVVEQTADGRTGERVIGYLATLTYFYRNPELQIGEFCRSFGEEAEAQSWAAANKGRTVMVRVNPRDPTRSVLRPEDL